MEVVAATPNTGNVPPFHDHDVREWSRIDSLTGVLERARLETDHWTANTNNSSHKYGKVVDSRARTDADGALQQQARRQLEVFQSHIPGAHLQVIKTHTVSSSRWSNANQIKTSENKVLKDFENLQLTLNPLDLSSQKSKANVGRSVGRRPPSRRTNPHLNTAATNLHRVSRLCHQIHESAVKQAFARPPPEEERQSGDGSVEIYEIDSNNLRRSTSSEDVLSIADKDSSTKSIEDLEDLEQLQSWRRTSKIRRSLQLKPKQIELPENSVSVRKIREDLEQGRRLNTALRGNTVDLEALDQILQSISSSSSIISDDNESEKKTKRNSFVTVESIQEVKGRLRRTSSPSIDIYKPKEDLDPDDGIVTEETSRVRSYVYGMEAMLKKPSLGTNSLESRPKLVNGRSEDWYNRRKSYGFEKVQATNSASLKDKNLVESSTDSGICRSSEIVEVPTATRYDYSSDANSDLEQNGITFGNVKKMTNIFNHQKATTITIPIAKNNNNIVDLAWNGDETNETSDDSKGKNKLSDEELLSNNRKTKKVEFCKTEVHFAADSGKVNIVETDEKPPPTNNFRRRRRNSGPILSDFNKNGLPVLHFGDTGFEKSLFSDENHLYENLQEAKPILGVVTVNTNHHIEYEDGDRFNQNEGENIKGILKNKPIKPKPYHLGEMLTDDDEDTKWGVKLRHVPKEETPIWKSTITLHPYQDKFEKYSSTEDDQPEFQKLLKNLRPTKKSDFLSDSEHHRYSDSFSSIRVLPTDNRRSSWSVAEDGNHSESKGYSTKVNFGDGQATVVESDRHPTWPRMESSSKEEPEPVRSKYIINTTNNSKYSPVVLRKTILPSAVAVNRSEISTTSEKLSSPALVGKNVQNEDFKTHSNMVLRQPKKSEMTYFGVKVSPIPTRSQETVQPDLLQHYKPITPEKKDSPPPIYENLKPARREFDSGILDELTKAADQILQAVNGYTDEETQQRLSTDDEETKKKNKINKQLDTINENPKAWKKIANKPRPPAMVNKPKLKHTSSTSSVESSTRRITNKPVATSLTKKQPEVEKKSNTKARRLQRASSREALLQSHGSSSEDLSINVETPVRKPRLIKKTKQSQFTVTNGIDIKKPVNSSTSTNSRVKKPATATSKTEERILGSLPEIRHKTAVSTIRSTAEKNSRDRSRHRAEETKKKLPLKKDLTTKGGPINSTPNKLSRSTASRETVTHRISTANIKKCQRSDGGTRH